MITATISGRKIIVVGNKNLNFISSYIVEDKKDYVPNDKYSFTFRDNLDNTYNAMGLVIAGPDKDQQLASPTAYSASWNEWQDIFENFEIYR